ncbi:MAG: STAS domain-containing protein [Desulfovibrio sp.]
MDITNENKNGVIVLSVGGRMDAMTSGPFLEQCNEIVEGDPSNVVVDLGGLEYVSSAGLRSFLAFAKALKAHGKTLRFSGLTGMVEEVFTVSGFSRMFEILPTVDEAVAKG